MGDLKHGSNETTHGAEWRKLRGLVRRYLLTGDVTLRDGSMDSARGHSRNGLDTQARCELVSVLVALRCIQTKDRVAHQLLIRDIGRPCRFKVHSDAPGHCHRIPRDQLPLVVDMPYEEIDERTAQAVAWLISLAG